MELHSISEAADLLGVSPQRVRALAKAGRLDSQKVGGRWVIRGAPVRRRAHSGQPVSSANAWGVLALMVGDDGGWLDPSARSRLRRRMREPGWAQAGLEASQARSQVNRWRVLPSDLDKVEAEFPLVRSGLSADDRELDVVGPGGELDAYVDPEGLGAILKRFRPDLDPAQPNLILRVPSNRWILGHPRRAPGPVVAADLLVSDDPRVSRAARELLARYSA